MVTRKLAHQVKAGTVVKSITIQDQVDALKQAVEYLKANTITKADMDGSLNSLVHAVVAQLKPAPVQPPAAVQPPVGRTEDRTLGIVAPKPEEVKAVEVGAVAVMSGLTIEQVLGALDAFGYAEIQQAYSKIQILFRSKKDQFEKDKEVLAVKEKEDKAKREAELLKKQTEKAGGALFAIMLPKKALSKRKGSLEEMTAWMDTFTPAYKAQCKVVAVH